MKRLALLVNKAFEYEGFRRGVADVYAHQDFTGTLSLNEDAPKAERPYKKPVATYEFPNLHVDVYCIEYLFGKGENSSNSQVKFAYLHDLFRSITKPDYVVSVSTSESTPDSQKKDGEGKSVNGCVYVGNHFFLSDQQENDNPPGQSKLDVGEGGCAIYDDKVINDGLYEMIKAFESKIVEGMKPVPRSPAEKLRCHAGDNYTCVGVVNVMNYACYPKADAAAYKACGTGHGTRIGIETTHGVVKMAVAKAFGDGVPVMFVSPITDRYMKFDEDVGKDGAQNFASSFNGGVATANIVKILDELLRKHYAISGHAESGVANKSFTAENDLTLEAWIIPDASSANEKDVIISFSPARRSDERAVTGCCLALNREQDGVRLNLTVLDSKNYYQAKSEEININDGKPHHVLATRKDRETFAMFVDFQPVCLSVRKCENLDSEQAKGEGDHRFCIADNNTKFYEGGKFSGYVCESRVWNCVKRYSNVNDWVRNKSFDGLCARWTFKHAEGTGLEEEDNLNVEGCTFTKFII